MALDEAQRERLAKLREDEAKRQQVEQDESDARELESLDLTAGLEAKDQKRGHDFIVVNNPRGGVFAVRKPDGGGIRRWETAKEKERTNLEWMIGFLQKYIVETDEEAVKNGKPGRSVVWAQTCAKLPGLCWQTANAFVDLLAVDRSDGEKK